MKPQRVGWKEIADFLGVSEDTAQRYAKLDGLPVHGRRRRWARTSELAAWAKARDMPAGDAASSGVLPQ